MKEKLLNSLAVIIAKLIWILIITTCLYLIGCLFAWSFNPGHWHWVLRVFLGIPLIGSLLYIITR